MTERKMSEAERAAMDAANKIMGDMMFQARRKSRYIYYEAPDQRRFCYTPWKDQTGDYWTWVLKPTGKGARSGRARVFNIVGKRVRSRTRKTARKRAWTRYQNWLTYLNQEWRNN